MSAPACRRGTHRHALLADTLIDLPLLNSAIWPALTNSLNTIPNYQVFRMFLDLQSMTACVMQVFEMAMVLDDSKSTHYPILKIPARSKLSSLCWNGYIKSSLICADYDGVIQLWDIASASDVMQFDEHSRRVWSVDFSQVCLIDS